MKSLLFDTLPLGEIPSPDRIPKRMLAQVVRSSRYGNPDQAMREEEIPVPELEEDDVLIAVMAAGLNYNHVWACLGYPLDVISYRNRSGEKEDFHVGGSDASGIVVKIGTKVEGLEPGDEVIVQPGYFDLSDPWIRGGGDPCFSETMRAWGFETNYGSFAQFCKAKAYQCLPKPKNLNWEESASFMLTGATALRMLTRWEPNVLQKGDTVLVWGGAGGVGAIAVQIVSAWGGFPVAVVNHPEKAEFCRELGAKECIIRTEYSHWGLSYEHPLFLEEIGKIRSKISDATGSDPKIVIEHSGERTVLTSMELCAKGGMVVICGGTTGYLGSLPLRGFVSSQKRFQGSHFANPEECSRLLGLFRDGILEPRISKVYSFEEIPIAHKEMMENRQPPGNLVARVGSVPV